MLAESNVSQVASALGIDERQAASALQVALPALVTALQRNAASQDGLTGLTRARASRPGDVSDVLNDATSHIQRKSPDLMSTLGSLLDADHDGSAADDLVRMAGSLSELFATR